MYFSWMVNSGTYYGLSLSASNLGGNPYYNYLISAGVEIPAYAFNLLVLDRPWMGRRRALVTPKGMMEGEWLCTTECTSGRAA